MVGHVSMATCMCEREPLQPPGQKALFFFFTQRKVNSVQRSMMGVLPGAPRSTPPARTQETFGGLAVSKEHRMESYCSRKL